MSAVARAKSIDSVTHMAVVAGNQPTNFAPHVYTKREAVTTLDRRLGGGFVRSIDASNARRKTLEKRAAFALSRLKRGRARRTIRRTT